MVNRLAPPIIEADEGDYADIVYRNQVQEQANTAEIPSTGVLYTSLDFTDSNLNQLAVKSHQSLDNLQGGGAGEYYHLTYAQFLTLTTSGNPIRLTVSSSGGILFGTGASVTRVSAGLYTVTFSTARSTATYNVLATCNNSTPLVPTVVGTPSTTSFQISTFNLSGTAVDPIKLYITIV